MSCLRVFTLFLFHLLAVSVGAYDYDEDFDAANPDTWPIIAVIIDDIGNQRPDGERAIALPGPVAYAVLPHTPYAAELARAANELGKEIMLHQPLQATDNNHLLGEGAITLDQSASAVQATFSKNLASIPFVVGINNHMGSLLTRHPGHMRWLMQAIKQNGPLFFVDSVTSGRSVALTAARESGVPSVGRDVFLDSEQSAEAVAVQFGLLKQHARKHGYAVGIGHPFPETLDVLEKELPRLSGLGYRLVSIRSMIERQSDNTTTETHVAPPRLESFRRNTSSTQQPEE